MRLGVRFVLTRGLSVPFCGHSFFFSSRRRHTRCVSDWSSDVCSSDLAVLDKGTTVAGVFTRSKCPSAPVEWCRAQHGRGAARALVVNSGNANAFTGKHGREATKLTADVAAKAVGCRPGEVFLASTGVIGEPLAAEKFAAVMDDMVARAQPDPWLDAAGAIMTTDTFPKVATATVRLGPANVTINGIAKG